MKPLIPLSLMFLVFVTTDAFAQSRSADEKAIRDLIALIDTGKAAPATADMIFWSGAYKRPAIRGVSKPEPMPGLERRVGDNKTKTAVQRIDVSSSGDMAYEFSDAVLTVDEKGNDGKIGTRSFPTSVLRVWKKVSGQWMVAAQFARPHEQ